MPFKRINKTNKTYNKYTKELLEPIVRESISWGGVCKKLNVTPSTGAQTYIKKVAMKFNLDYSHFLGKASNRGRTLAYLVQPIERYLNNEIKIKSSVLRVRLIKCGLKENKCEICNLDKWLGGELPLELDHIDSNHYNNTLSNLQIICPNCHAVETAKRRELKK